MLEDIEESRSLWLFELGEQHKGLRIGDDAVLSGSWKIIHGCCRMRWNKV